jgi:PAS domain S-box-containing protein
MQAVQLILRRAAIDNDVVHAQSASAPASAFLRKLTDGAPQLRALSIADASGQLVASSAHGDYSHMNVSGRAYFQELQHAKGDAIAISESVVSIFDNVRTLPVAMRLQDANDRFTGVVIASTEDDYFRNFYERIDLTSGTRIRLLSRSGEPVTDYMRPPGIVGHDVRSVVHAVEGYPLTIEVSRATSTVLAPWYDTAINVFARTALISLFIALLAIFLVKQLRRVQQINEQLRSSEQRWRTAFEHAPIGVVVLRAGQRYVAANPAFQQMVGRTDAELMTVVVSDISCPEDVELARMRLSELAPGQAESVRFQMRFLHRDGHIVWADVRAACILVWFQLDRDGDGDQQDMVIATIEDITQRRHDEQQRQRLEQQLRQSQKLEALGTFAGGVAHDFNNILGAILGFGERAMLLLGSGTAERRYIEQVMKAGDRARLLVERILTFSRSGMTARLAVDVRAVVVEAIGLLSATLPGVIRLGVQLEDEELFVLGDATHLHQAVMNLCSNAAHAMPWRHARSRPQARVFRRAAHMVERRRVRRRLCATERDRYRCGNSGRRTRADVQSILYDAQSG